MESKSGQVTVYVIIGLIIIGTLFIFLVPMNQLEPIDEKTYLPAQVYLESCIGEQVKEIIVYMANQGGYFWAPDKPILRINESFVPFYIYENEQISHGNIEAEMSTVANQVVKHCINQSGYEIPNGEPLIETTITEDAVFLDIKYPIQVVSGDSVTIIDDIGVIVESKIGYFHQEAERLTKKQYDQLCLSCLSNISDYTIDLQKIENDNEAIVLISMEGELIFNFAYLYDIETVDDLWFREIPELNATLDYEFNYNIMSNAEFFTDDSNLFNVKNGSIDFTPKREDVGTHIVSITAHKGNQNMTQLFTLNIKDFGDLPEINYIGHQFARVGEKFTYQVICESHSGIIFMDDSHHINISLDGLIEYVPKTAGEYNFSVIAMDENGNTVSQPVYLVVVE